MGVDYSTTIGYGFYGNDDYDQLPAILKERADGKYLGEEHLFLWLPENGFDLIDYEKIGNWMSGPTFWFLGLKRTLRRFDQYDQDGVHSFDTPDLTVQEHVQLSHLKNLLGGTAIDNPKWVVSFNIS